MLQHPDGSSKCAVPFFRGNRNATVSRLLHELELEVYPASFFRILHNSLFWPFHAMFRAGSATWQYGVPLRKRHAPGLMRQFADQWRLLLRHNISPEIYRDYSLWDASRRGDLDSYFSEYQVFRLDRWLHKHVPGLRFDDKLQFFESCRQHGLPTPEVLAHSDALKPPEMSRTPLPRRSFFVKDRFGRKGNHAQRWIYDPSSSTWKRGGVALNEAALKQHLMASFASIPFIMQELLENHRDIGRFSDGPVCTLRVVTFRCPGERAQVFLPVLRMPNGSTDADNLAQGGLVSGVLEDGRLTPAGSRTETSCLSSHPRTKARIEGQPIPFWKEAQSLAITAHERLSEHYTIGWDIALTPRGPCLIEGNRGWSVNVIQLGHHCPIGASAYPQLMSAAIKHRLRSHPEPRMQQIAAKLKQLAGTE